jgi:Tfp pilus assembly protein PilN
MAGLLAAIAAGTHHNRLGEGFDEAEASMRKSGATARKPPAASAPARDPQTIALEVKRASEIAVQLKLPWRELFASVEAASTPDVALLSIESDTGKRQVSIGAEARDLDSMLGYLRVLSQTPAFSNVHLQSHRLQEQDPQRPVRFVIAADWASFRR